MATLIQVMNKFDMQLPQTSDLQAIVALHRDGTVSQAARQLGVSQSALSYTLDRMRKHFDDPLFVRVGNRMMATPFALQLQDPAGRVLRILQTEIADAKRFDPATTTRDFRLAVNEIGAITMVPKLMRPFAAQAPHARLSPVQIAKENMAAALESGDVDIVAGYVPDMAGDLLQQRLFSRSYVCIARGDHPEIGSAMTLEELARHPQVQTKSTPTTISWLETQLRGKAPGASKHVLSQHIAAVPFIVAASDFIAIIPQEVYELFRPITGVKAVNLPLQIPPVAIHQYWHSRLAADPAVRFLRELICQTMQEGAG